MLYCRSCAQELDAVMHIRAFNRTADFVQAAICQMCDGPGPCAGADASKAAITRVDWRTDGRNSFYEPR